MRQHIQPIPENPHDPVIQKVFADIREKNALMQNSIELSTDLKVTPNQIRIITVVPLLDVYIMNKNYSCHS